MNHPHVRTSYILAILVLVVIWMTLFQSPISPSYAQSTTPTVTPLQPTPIVSATPIGSSPTASTSVEVDLAVLKSEMQMMRDYNQQLLSVVQWAIGGVLAIVIILLGAQWYTNTRSYERDKTALKDEVNASLQKELAILRQQISSLVTKAVDSKVEVIGSDLKRIKIDLLTMEADNWEREKIYANALRCCMQVIPLAESISWDFITADMLGRIQRFVRLGMPLGSVESVDLTTLLNTLPPKYITEVEGIRSLQKLSGDAKNNKEYKIPPPPPPPTA